MYVRMDCIKEDLKVDCHLFFTNRFSEEVPALTTDIQFIFRYSHPVTRNRLPKFHLMPSFSPVESLIPRLISIVCLVLFTTFLQDRDSMLFFLKTATNFVIPKLILITKTYILQINVEGFIVY